MHGSCTALKVNNHEPWRVRGCKCAWFGAGGQRDVTTCSCQPQVLTGYWGAGSFVLMGQKMEI